MEINTKTKNLFKKLFHKLDLKGYSENLDFKKINSYGLIETDDMEVIQNNTGKIIRIDFNNLRVEYKGWKTGHRRIQAEVLWWYLENVYLRSHYEVFENGRLINMFTDVKELRKYGDDVLIRRFHEHEEK